MKRLKLTINKVYTYLSIAHPLILLNIILVIYFILSIYYNNPYLCDGDNLEELHNKLTSLHKEYYETNKEYEQYSDLLYQASKRTDCVKENGIERYLSVNKDKKLLEITSTLFKIRMIEASIKIKDPNFVSTIKRE